MFFRKNRVRLAVEISNIVLAGIPTQSLDVYIKIKCGKKKYETTPSPIVGNMIHWPNPSSFACTIVKEKTKATRPQEKIRFSFRIPGKNKKFARFGFTEFDIYELYFKRKGSISAPLQKCQYNPEFSFQYTIKYEDIVDIDSSELSSDQLRRVSSEIFSNSEPETPSGPSNPDVCEMGIALDNQARPKCSVDFNDLEILEQRLKITPSRLEDLEKEVDSVLFAVTS